ncbi:MAG: tape measure protein [Clostridia bacterium]|nr:tape measure protein [Clostridia bacterium]MBR5271869.1 tape measure protein [Clostridia bacterium]
MKNEEGKSYYELLLNVDKTSVNKAMQEFSRIGNHAEVEGKRIDNIFKKVGAGMAAYFAVDTLTGFGKEVIKVRGEIESLEVSFGVLLGSEDKAKKFFGELREFAVETPMGLNDLAKGAQTMLGFNMAAEKVMPTLKQIGDISMGNSQRFNSLVLAFAQMHSAGKLMGTDLLQMINAGFNPLSVIAEKTGKNISVLKDEMSKGAISADMVADAFASATAEGGKFHNMLMKQSKGIEGAKANFEGAIQDVINGIGTDLQPVIVDAYSLGTKLAKNYETVGSVLLYLISTYGTYKAALIAVNTIEKVNIAILRQAIVEKRLAAMSNITLSNSAAIAAAKTKLLSIAQKGLVTSLKGLGKALTNPYLLAATAITTAGFALYEFINRETEAEHMQRTYNDTKQRAAELEEEHKEKVNELIESIEDETAAEMERAGAMETLKQLYPGIIEKYIDEEGHLKNLIALKKELAGVDAERKQQDNRNELAELDRQIREREAYLTNMRSGDQSAYDDEAKVIEELRRQREIARQNVASDYINNAISKAKGKSDAELQAEISAYQKALSDNQGGEWFGSGKDFKTEEIRKYISALVDLQAARAGVVQNKDYWKKQKEDAEKALEAMAVTEKGSLKWNQTVSRIREAEKNLDMYSIPSGKSGGKADNNQQQMADELLSMRRANQQAEIDLMKEGSEKKRAQIELNYQKEIDEVKKQKKAWEDEQNGILTDEQRSALGAKAANAMKSRETGLANITKEETEEANRAMNEYLAEYGSYLEKRNATIALYDERIKNAATQGEKDTLAAKMREELSALDMEANKTTSAIARLFDDMSSKTVKDMREIAAMGEEAFQFLMSGEWDEEKGIKLGISKETFETLRKSPEELEKIRKGIKDVTDAADKSENAFGKMAKGLEKVFKAGESRKQLQEGLELIEGGLNDCLQVGGFLSDTLSSLGDAFGSGTLSGIAEGLNVAMDAASSAMSGAEVGKMFGPIGAAIGGAIGLVSSLAGSFAKLHDKKHEKRIQKIQEQIEVLEKNYDKLSRSIEKAYSKDASKLIEDQNTLLQQQKILIQQQIKEEEDKKNTDNGRIKEWKAQIEEIDQLIADNKEKAIDAIFGEDVNAAIDDFASSYAEAWASSEDKAESAKDTVKRMMRQMVTESIKAAIQSSGKMEQIRQKLQQFYADNVLSGWEQDYIYRMAEELQKQLDSQFGWADSLMTDPKDDEETEREGVKKGIATASQESVDENNARLTTIQGHTFGIKADTEAMRKEMAAAREMQREVRDLAYTAVEHLAEISKNTRELYETNRRLKSVEESLDDINTRGVIIRK